MKTRTIVAILTLMAAILIVGCGGGDDAPPPRESDGVDAGRVQFVEIPRTVVPTGSSGKPIRTVFLPYKIAVPETVLPTRGPATVTPAVFGTSTSVPVEVECDEGIPFYTEYPDGTVSMGCDPPPKY